MRKKIKINPDGGKVSFNVKILGFVLAGYNVRLYEKITDEKICTLLDGTNVQSDDDSAELPGTAKENVGRWIYCSSNIGSLDDYEEESDDNESSENEETKESSTNKYECSVIFEVVQDGEIVDRAVDKKIVADSVQKSIVAVKLVGS